MRRGGRVGFVGMGWIATVIGRKQMRIRSVGVDRKPIWLCSYRPLRFDQMR